jgi:hypothetical protein
MKELYKQIINGVEYQVILASHKELKEEITGNPNSESEYWGTHYGRKQQIIISDDLSLENATRAYVHEYTHAYRFVNGYDTQRDELSEEALCDYIMMNYYTIYHMAEHFKKHYEEVTNEI